MPSSTAPYASRRSAACITSHAHALRLPSPLFCLSRPLFVERAHDALFSLVRFFSRTWWTARVGAEAGNNGRELRDREIKKAALRKETRSGGGLGAHEQTEVTANRQKPRQRRAVSRPAAPKTTHPHLFSKWRQHDASCLAPRALETALAQTRGDDVNPPKLSEITMAAMEATLSARLADDPRRPEAVVPFHLPKREADTDIWSLATIGLGMVALFFRVRRDAGGRRAPRHQRRRRGRHVASACSHACASKPGHGGHTRSSTSTPRGRPCFATWSATPLVAAATQPLGSSLPRASCTVGR